MLAAIAAAAGIAGLTWWRRRPRSAGTATTTPTRPAEAARPGAAAAPFRRAAIVALLISVVVAGAVVAAHPAGIAPISILDVGQGDAILIEGSRGGRLLIDGGPDPDRLLVELDRRIPPWDRRIDAVVLSHPHEDHVAGLALLLERYHVSRVFEPGMRGPGPGYAAWLRDLAGPGAPVRLGLAAGDRLTVDEIGLRALWPIRGRVPSTPPDGGTGINNVSVVFLGQIGRRHVLLMGDVEEGIDPSLLADGLPHVDLLKVAHHGSRTATTQAFVGRDATHGRGRVGGRRQPLRPSGQGDARPTGGVGRRGAADRSRRDGRGRVRGGRMTVRTEGAAAAAANSTPVALAIARSGAPAPSTDVPVCDPGHGARPDRPADGADRRSPGPPRLHGRGSPGSRRPWPYPATSSGPRRRVRHSGPEIPPSLRIRQKCTARKAAAINGRKITWPT